MSSPLIAEAFTSLLNSSRAMHRFKERMAPFVERSRIGEGP